MTAILEITGLRIKRGKTFLLRDISWQVRPGEHWAILGPNGCGKTSLLKALTGYLPPTAGRIGLLGATYGKADWRELRLKVGLVTSALQASIPPAEPALETVISGRYAQLDLWAPKTRTDAGQAKKLLRFVGASGLAEREWMHLSQGERQRILIARSLMARPRLLILDEPCAGLDPVAREQFLEFLDSVARRRGGPTLVLVTHHVEEVTAAFTHALLLRSGRVAASGPKVKILTTRAVSAVFGARIALRRQGGRYRAGAIRLSSSQRFR